MVLNWLSDLEMEVGEMKDQIQDFSEGELLCLINKLSHQLMVQWEMTTGQNGIEDVRVINRQCQIGAFRVNRINTAIAMIIGYRDELSSSR